MSNIKTEIRMVTPEWARSIIDKLDKDIADGKYRQRHVSLRRVTRYAADMAAGNWGTNGESITIDENDHLMNGQHRLRAVCKAGVSVQMVIVWGVPEMVNDKIRTIDTVDTGCNRTVSSQLRIDGYQYSQPLAAAAKLTAILAHGSGRQVSLNISPAQLILVAKLIDGHVERIVRPILEAKAKHLMRSYIITPLVFMRAFDADTADLFTVDLIEMANLGKGNPVLALRRFLDRPYRSKGSNNYQMDCAHALASALFFYATEKKVDTIRGSQEHVDWLLKNAKNLVKRTREIIQSDTTLAGLELKQ